MFNQLRKVRFTLPLIFWCAASLAQIKDPTALAQYEEIAHENKGCPENSECDALMGEQILKWKKFLESRPSDQGLAAYTKQVGWPSLFYARASIRSTLAPILFDSHCSLHNPKDSEHKLLKAISFIKSTQGEHAHISKGGVDYKLKLNEVIILSKIVLHLDSKQELVFYLPLGERPLFFHNEELVTLVESEDFYALLHSKKDGSWRFSLPSSALMAKMAGPYAIGDEVKCPEKAHPIAEGFQKTWCRELPDQAGKRVGIVQVFWACD
jgi:hypothetical protein